MSEFSIKICFYENNKVMTGPPLRAFIIHRMVEQPSLLVLLRFQPCFEVPLPSSLKTVPWLRMVTCLHECVQIKSVLRVGP